MSRLRRRFLRDIAQKEKEEKLKIKNQIITEEESLDPPEPTISSKSEENKETTEPAIEKNVPPVTKKPKVKTTAKTKSKAKTKAKAKSKTKKKSSTKKTTSKKKKSED